VTRTPEPGDRVRMTGVMPDDPHPLTIGDTGTVVGIGEHKRQIYVEWDSGRGLILLDTDPFNMNPERERI